MRVNMKIYLARTPLPFPCPARRIGAPGGPPEGSDRFYMNRLMIMMGIIFSIDRLKKSETVNNKFSTGFVIFTARVLYK